MLQPSNSSQVRVSNMRTLLTAIRDHGPIAKRELQQITGLSWGSVSSLTTILLRSGYVVAERKLATASGRWPDELDINSNDNYIIGLDLNITGLCGVITDMKGRIVQEWMRLFPNLDYDCVLGTLFSLLDSIFEEYDTHNIVGIGMAVQGVVNTRDGVSVWFPRVTGWNNIPLAEILFQRYGLPIKLWHDPNCIMIAERVFGTPFMADAQDALLIRMDQGIGMSIMSNGKLHLGATGETGELLHMVVDADGPICPFCGNPGCLGLYACGGGLTARFIEEVNRNRPTKLAVENIQTLTYRDIAMAAHQGDALSLEMFYNLGLKMGQALSTLYCIFNPELIVIYGDMCQHRELFLAPLQEQLQKRLRQQLDRDFPVQLIFSELGRNAAALGAAMMVSNETIGSMDFKEWDSSNAE